ncbi:MULTISPECIES: hypothetical protein [unclassified Sphingomonas]|uniref:hypothetical protein n=1 Tax=unclassified Sphingomonas TaxID=196159 RepID=UPI0006F66A4F|nr:MULTISPECIES: hypothetical protein [unclassified Sphingomonas]KQM59884.1 hypothetical protein ASE65_09110 [Sphingomonas sp. Leaf16]KQN11282.1 hypothetical protein ASE81_10095 [Sphingomonas sp. Leaf29]KQN18604.1 hypothetical protein ASE83_10040 [Sphingomonas sp. Leaf32]
MERNGRQRGNLLASAAIGPRQAGRIAAPAEQLVIDAAFAADASCSVTLTGETFVLPDAASAFVSALRALPDHDQPLTLAVRGGAMASARQVGAILQLIRSAGRNNVTVTRND